MVETKNRIIIIPDLFIVIKLLEEGPKSATNIQYEAKINYSHINRMKKGMLDKELITISKKGREKIIFITEKGKKLLSIINNYLEFFNIKTQDMNKYRRISEEKEKKKDIVVIEDEIIEDEVIKDEIIEDEVIKDEIIEDEIIEDEVIKDEVIKDEVIKDGNTENI